MSKSSATHQDVAFLLILEALESKAKQGGTSLGQIIKNLSDRHPEFFTYALFNLSRIDDLKALYREFSKERRQRQQNIASGDILRKLLNYARSQCADAISHPDRPVHSLLYQIVKKREVDLSIGGGLFEGEIEVFPNRTRDELADSFLDLVANLFTNNPDHVREFLKKRFGSGLPDKWQKEEGRLDQLHELQNTLLKHIGNYEKSVLKNDVQVAATHAFLVGQTSERLRLMRYENAATRGARILESARAGGLSREKTDEDTKDRIRRRAKELESDGSNKMKKNTIEKILSEEFSTNEVELSIRTIRRILKK